MTTAPEPEVSPYGFTIGDRLRKAREVAGMDQRELARITGATRTTISNNESGRVQPRALLIRAIAHATGAPLHWLETGHTEIPHPDNPDGGCSLCAIRDSNPEPAGSVCENVVRFPRRPSAPPVITRPRAA